MPANEVDEETMRTTWRFRRQFWSPFMWWTALPTLLFLTFKAWRDSLCRHGFSFVSWKIVSICTLTFVPPAICIHVQGVANRSWAKLHLTPSTPGLSGSVWHIDKQSVIGGFSTEFSFRITSNKNDEVPGPCKRVDHDPDSCARRGGDGFAFVLQNHGPISLGTAGGSLGYGGIPNAVAVEFDTWYDAELRDPYENHIAILTRGERQLRPEHSNHLGVCIDVPDFADGEIHRIRLDYDPVFHADIVSHVSFQAGPHLATLVYPAAVGFRHGLGAMRVYTDHIQEPILIVPIDLAAFLSLDSGTAWVGFTASTGKSYQRHEVLSWSFFEEATDHSSVSRAEDAHFTLSQNVLVWIDSILGHHYSLKSAFVLICNSSTSAQLRDFWRSCGVSYPVWVVLIVGSDCRMGLSQLLED